MIEPNEHVVVGSDLGQHFQNYFELLLSAERAKLRSAINAERGESGRSVHSLINHIEQRMAFLKGAVRMGQLLCLINSEEAKSKHQILRHEHENLSLSCRRKFDEHFADEHDAAKPRPFHSLLSPSQ